MSNRLYTNNEIQKKTSAASHSLFNSELDKRCTKDHSRSIFDINLSLFLRVSSHSTRIEKLVAVKDEKDQDRFTLDYRFDFNRFIYATRWCSRIVEYVEFWMLKYQKSNLNEDEHPQRIQFYPTFEIS